MQRRNKRYSRDGRLRERLVAPGNGGSPLGRMHSSFPEPYLLLHAESSSLFPCNAPIRSIPHLPRVRVRIRLMERARLAAKKFRGRGNEGRGNPRNGGSAAWTNFPSPRMFLGYPMTHVYVRESARGNPPSRSFNRSLVKGFLEASVPSPEKRIFPE